MGTFLKKKKMKYACLVAVVAVILTAECAFGQTFGIDVSMSVSESQFANGHRNGNFSFAIPRAWHSYGAADTEAPDNVWNARAAGYARVDVYAFVCPGGGGASSQIDGLVKFIRDNRMEIDTVWLDVEGPQYWTGSVSGNQQYMTELVDSMRSSGMRFGVYCLPVSGPTSLAPGPSTSP